MFSIYEHVKQAIIDSVTTVINTGLHALISVAQTGFSLIVDRLPTVSLPAELNADISWVATPLATMNALFPLSALAAAMVVLLTLTNLDWLLGVLTAAWRFLMRNGW